MLLKLHRLSTDDVASLIELDIAHLRSALEAVSRHVKRHADDLGPDAKHWLTDLSEQTDAFVASLTFMECESCERLAVWLHPDCNERYCEEHRQDFVECAMCGQWMYAGDVVTDPTGTNAGHAHCLDGDEA